MRGAKPFRSSAVRPAPQACTSSAPKDDTPTSVTQTGKLVAACTSASLAGHSSIIQRFQSSGKPCTAKTSTSSSTPSLVIRSMKETSIGEIPPSTRWTSGWLVRMAFPAKIAISENLSHWGSISGSQCDLLLGSFQIIAASIMNASCLSYKPDLNCTDDCHGGRCRLHLPDEQ